MLHNLHSIDPLQWEEVEGSVSPLALYDGDEEGNMTAKNAEAKV